MADQRFKIEDGLVVQGGNNVFEEKVTINANLNVEGSLLFVGQDLFVTGNLVYTNTQVAGDLTPYDDGANLGNTVNRFDLFAFTVQVDGSIVAGANGIPIGNTTRRFDVFAGNVDATGVVTVLGNTSFNTDALVVDTTNKAVAINTTAPYTGTKLTVVGNTSVNGNINVVGGGNLAVNGNITANGGVSVNGAIQTTNSSITFNKSSLVSTRTQVTNTSANIIDQFPTSSGKFAKILISVDNSTSTPSVIHTVEMLIAHDRAGNVLATKYAELFNTKLGVFDASVSGANVIVTFTAATTNTYNVTTLRQLILD
jgi:hypothetical protein